LLEGCFKRLPEGNPPGKIKSQGVSASNSHPGLNLSKIRGLAGKGAKKQDANIEFWEYEERKRNQNDGRK